MQELLSGSDWKLEGYLPDGHIYNMESGIDFKIWPMIQEVKAAVPGCVYRDLADAGIIDDPYKDFNALKSEWIGNKDWRYFKTFDVPKRDLRRHADLVFEGLNFEARIYLNGSFLGDHKNVNTAAVFSADGILKEHNMLEVLLLKVPQDVAQMGKSSDCALQSARFSYSWDFSTRLVGVGIWKDVSLYLFDAARIDNVYILTDAIDGVGKILLKGKCIGRGGIFSGAEAHIEVSLDGIILHKKHVSVVGKSFDAVFEIQDPRLWYPSGYGEQPLYDIAVTLFQGETEEDKKTYRVGLRHLEYQKNENSPADALNYTIAVNGKKIYLKGANFLPMDHMLGTMTKKRYEDNFALIKDANINLLRLWGGGVRENEIFFDLCDRNGILVWQDFTQSNSGIDGSPSVRPEFLDEFTKSCIEILYQCRSRTCVAIYCGGNELKDKFGKPVSFDNPNIAHINKLVETLDPSRIFHPSCPSGPNFVCCDDAESIKKQKNHNVHGQWAYFGKDTHYNYYNKGDYLYHGEFGVNGCSDIDSLKKFISPQYLTGYKTSSALWTYRNFTWWDSFARECDIFGREAMEKPECYAAASQLIQAEGLRYILTQNRNRAFACSGNNIWQFCEPWPNPNCSNIVDYYLHPKQAYYAVKESYQNQNINLSYTKLYYEVGEKLDFAVRVGSFTSVGEIEAVVEMRNEKGEVLLRRVQRVDTKNLLAEIPFPQQTVTDACGQVFFVRLQLLDKNHTLINDNLYIFGTRRETPYRPLFDMRPEVNVCCQSNCGKKYITVQNVGTDPALCLNLFTEDMRGVLFEQNFFTLFAGERRTIAVIGSGEQEIFIKDLTASVRMHCAQACAKNTEEQT